jgi:hypothetical protein
MCIIADYWGTDEPLCDDRVVVAKNAQSSLETSGDGLYVGTGKDYAPNTLLLRLDRRCPHLQSSRKPVVASLYRNKLDGWQSAGLPALLYHLHQYCMPKKLFPLGL